MVGLKRTEIHFRYGGRNLIAKVTPTDDLSAMTVTDADTGEIVSSGYGPDLQSTAEFVAKIMNETLRG